MAFFRPEHYPRDPKAQGGLPAEGLRMPAPPPIGTDTDNDRLREQQTYDPLQEQERLRRKLGALCQEQGQRPATAEDYGPLHDQGPQSPSRPLRWDRAWMNQMPRQTPPQGAARAALKDRIARLHYDADCIRREANTLETLLRSIPENLPPDADEALWGLLTKS